MKPDHCSAAAYLELVELAFDRTHDERESPPWDLDDEYVDPLLTERASARDSVEDGEIGPPPPSQVKVAEKDSSATDGQAFGSSPVQELGGKTTPSTLSDNVDEDAATDAASGRRRLRGGAGSKKRSGSKGGEQEERDAVEEGQDSKHRPRKSARLA